MTAKPAALNLEAYNITCPFVRESDTNGCAPPALQLLSPRRVL